MEKRNQQPQTATLGEGVTETPKINDLRVWWSSRMPITKNSLEIYPVKDKFEARDKVTKLINRDLIDDSITDNVGGLEIFEEDDGSGSEGWCEFYCEHCSEDIFKCECEVTQ